MSSEKRPPDSINRDKKATGALHCLDGIACAVDLAFVAFDAALLGGAWPSKLRVHALRNGLQSSDRIGIAKNTQKEGGRQITALIDRVVNWDIKEI